jgi:hypothetical protein
MQAPQAMSTQHELFRTDAVALHGHISSVCEAHVQAAPYASAEYPPCIQLRTGSDTFQLSTAIAIALTGHRFVPHAQLCAPPRPPLAPINVTAPPASPRSKGGKRAPSDQSDSDVDLIKASCELPACIGGAHDGAGNAVSECHHATGCAHATESPAGQGMLCASVPEGPAPMASTLFGMYTGDVPGELTLQQLVELLQTCGYVCDAAVLTGLPAYLAPSRQDASTEALLALFAAAVPEQCTDEVAQPLAAWLSDARHDGALAGNAAAVWDALAHALSPAQCLSLAGHTPRASGRRRRSSSSRCTVASPVRPGSTMQCALVYAAALACDSMCDDALVSALECAWAEVGSSHVAGALMAPFLAAVEHLCPCRRACIARATGGVLGASAWQRLQCAPIYQPIVTAEGARAQFVVRTPLHSEAHGPPAWSHWASVALAGEPMRWRMRHRIRQDACGERTLLLSFEYDTQGRSATMRGGGANARHFSGAAYLGADSQLSIALGCVQQRALARLQRGLLHEGEAPPCCEVEEDGLRGEVFAVDRAFEGRTCHSFVVHSSLQAAALGEAFADEEGCVAMFAEACFTA